MFLESQRGGQRMRLLDDPLAVRALAHPVRVDLYALIGREGPMTAAEAGRRLGISQALASHHLRQLAKYGFVEPVPGKDHRERPWRVVATSMSWEEAESTQDGAAAADLLEQVFIEAAVNRYIQWQRARGAADPRWREAAGASFTFVYLTHEELSGIVTGIDALIRPYIEQRPLDDPTRRPAGSVPVDLTLLTSLVPPSGAHDDAPMA